MNLFSYESSRIFKSRFSIVYLLLLLLATIISVNSGINEFKGFEDRKGTFQKVESDKIKKYPTYEWYAGYGFKILYYPSPLVIFTSSGSVMQNLEGLVSSGEIIEIRKSYKGRGTIKKSKYFDFSGLIFIFGGFYMIIMGIQNFKGENYIQLFHNHRSIFWSILTRVVLLEIVFALIFIINLFFAAFNGITFSGNDLNNFVFFSGYSALVLHFAYFIGLIVSILIKFKKPVIIFVAGVCILFLIPELSNRIFSNSSNLPSEEKLNLEKLDALATMEKRAKEKIGQLIESKADYQDIRNAKKESAFGFLKNEYLDNKKRENEYNNNLKAAVKAYENTIVFIPSSYFDFLSGEFSSMGYYGYFDFSRYLIDIRDRFMRFYLDKRYNSADSKVITFTKGDENVFKAGSTLPSSFWKGYVIILFYIVFLFAASYIILRRRMTKSLEFAEPTADMENEKFFFCHLKNEEDVDLLFNYYRKEKKTTCIDHIEGSEIDPGIRLDKTLEYFCRKQSANVDKAVGYTIIMGIENLKTAKRTPENIKKIYFAVLMSTGNERVVINNFLDKASRVFEEAALAIMKEEKDKGRAILYLKDEIFQTKGSEKLSERTGRFHFYDIPNPTRLILR